MLFAHSNWVKAGLFDNLKALAEVIYDMHWPYVMPYIYA